VPPRLLTPASWAISAIACCASQEANSEWELRDSIACAAPQGAEQVLGTTGDRTMRDAQRRLRATLQFLMTSEIPSEHKIVLIDTVIQALREHEAASERGQLAAQASAQWQPHETEQLREYLNGRVASSWQHADELAVHLAAQLHRHRDDVRAKAAELGFGVAVDFRLAKAQVRSERE